MHGDKVEIITFHGWGFSPAIWDGFEKNLCALENLDIRHADRGYFRKENLPAFQQTDSRKIIIVHSYGLHWCPPEWIQSADHMIILSGFLSFHPRDPEKSRRSRHMLRQMKSRFVDEPEEVLNQFYENVFLPDKVNYQPGNRINHDRLLDDLEHLETSVINPDLLHGADQVTIIHGEEDQIVSNHKAHELFSMFTLNAQYFEIKHAGHGVLYTHAEECSRFLKPNFELN
jgi:pimeloyl-[acyl-carrier protein] methyl ester esterase